MQRGKAFFLVLVLLAVVSATGICAAPVDQQNDPQMDVGSGYFEMPEATGANDELLRVYYYRPAAWQLDGPVLIVMHGLKRNAADYLDNWREHAENHQVLLVCPEMSERKYPGTRYYNLGNVVDQEGAAGLLQPEEEWIFPVIDRVFGEVKQRSGALREGFALYGHSAGAQFVHRYLLFSRQSKAERIVAANAGWYTMPEETIPFPYGVAGLNLPPEQLVRAFSRPVAVLLGEKDTDPNHRLLRRTPEADRQGLYRLERGRNFFLTAQEKANALGAPFAWKLLTVPSVGHSDTGMSQTAIRVIAGEL
ncbi:MAG TPA: alpha/beta hydrolase [Patescibacteria group bacterium]|nr:alpha/beta hydrolase [Patescibacteria group bacterium]